jgi:hypothetical protein
MIKISTAQQMFALVEQFSWIKLGDFFVDRELNAKVSMVDFGLDFVPRIITLQFVGLG